MYRWTILAVAAALVACGGGGGGGSASETGSANTAPIISLTAVSNVNLGSIATLDGSATKGKEGDTLSFAWSILNSPVGNTSVIVNPGISKATFTPAKPGEYTIRLTVTDSKGLSAFSDLKFTALALSADKDRSKTQWLISESTSTLDGTKTTRMVAPSLGGANFVITCNSKGVRSYRIETEFITGGGGVRYRVGNYPVTTESWFESQSTGFNQLNPPSFNLNILKQFYKSNEFILDTDKFGFGGVRSQPRMVGFPAAIDKTRVTCGWLEADFPAQNGFQLALPDVPPETARQPTYDTTATSQFGFVAWLGSNAQGKPQLLVRVGGNKALCKGSSGIQQTAFLVEQSGRLVEAVPGFELGLSCETELPMTLALQGDFDPASPFSLKAFPFYFSVLSPGKPFAEVKF